MKRPGARLRALATRVLDPSGMERLVDPAIADMQHEHEEATRQGSSGAAAGLPSSAMSRSSQSPPSPRSTALFTAAVATRIAR